MPRADMHVGAYGPGLIWDGDIDDAALQEIARREALELRVWRSDQQPLGPLARLLEIPELRGLTLLPCRALGAKDWAVVTRLSGLRYFHHGHLSASGVLDLAGMQQLESLVLPSWKGLRWGAMTKLRHLSFYRWKSREQSLEIGAPDLEALFLSRSDLQDLRGISHFSKLKSLCLENCRELASLDGVEQLRSLEEISIDATRNTLLTDVSQLSRCRNLKRILIHNCPRVQSFPFAELPLLEAVWLWGTPIVDGKLAWLAACPTLLHAAIQKRPHHDCDVEQLPRAPQRLAYRSPPTYEFLQPEIWRYQELLAADPARVFLYPQWFRERHRDMCHGI